MEEAKHLTLSVQNRLKYCKLVTILTPPGGSIYTNNCGCTDEIQLISVEIRSSKSPNGA